MSQLRDPLINIIREPSLAAQLTPAQWNLALCQAEAAQLMENLRITCLLVVDKDHRLCGALNSNDLMRAKVI